MSDNRAQQRLADVCQAAVIALSADGSAATLVARTGPTLVHATDATAARLEREQQTCGEGPSLAAFAVQAPMIIDDLRGDDARHVWPLLAHGVNEVGVGRFVALPVGVGGIRLGVLSIYSRLAGALSPGQLSAGLLAADTAGLALLDAEGAVEDVVPLSDLGPVLDYRIHQATGMIMGQTGFDAHDALTCLRARAFRDNVPLQRVATEVIDRLLTFAPEKP